jgi:hypothetical protein
LRPRHDTRNDGAHRARPGSNGSGGERRRRRNSPERKNFRQAAGDHYVKPLHAGLFFEFLRKGKEGCGLLHVIEVAIIYFFF